MTDHSIDWLVCYYMLLLAISVSRWFIPTEVQNPLCVSPAALPFLQTPLTPLCDGDQDAAAPVDEEALWGAAVLSLHADIGRTEWFPFDCLKLFCSFFC